MNYHYLYSVVQQAVATGETAVIETPAYRITIDPETEDITRERK